MIVPDVHFLDIMEKKIYAKDLGKDILKNIPLPGDVIEYKEYEQDIPRKGIVVHIQESKEGNNRISITVASRELLTPRLLVLYPILSGSGEIRLDWRSIHDPMDPPKILYSPWRDDVPGIINCAAKKYDSVCGPDTCVFYSVSCTFPYANTLIIPYLGDTVKISGKEWTIDAMFLTTGKNDNHCLEYEELVDEMGWYVYSEKTGNIVPTDKWPEMIKETLIGHFLYTGESVRIKDLLGIENLDKSGFRDPNDYL
jgi:hypothetical protein